MATINIFKHETNVQYFSAGETIFAQGEMPTLMYVVQDGEVDILLNGQVVETAAPGGILGEMALVDDSPRSATAVAKTDCRLVPLDEKSFLDHIHRTPFFALQVMRILTDRLRNMNTAV
ncbi:MAG: cyclic nucleotide-binding domain-containing protein [Anaerolineales bacterium]|nr:cyclic nucleotide-binding domain-containing protein [Anaerolineales bacterium]